MHYFITQIMSIRSGIKKRLEKLVATFSIDKEIKMVKNIKDVIQNKISHLSAETVGWIAVMIIHASTIPNFIAVMNGFTEKLPQVDILLMVWTGLALFFLKAVIAKDMLNIVTIGLGFIIQATMLALIFVK